jgi:hypothetical protein
VPVFRQVPDGLAYASNKSEPLEQRRFPSASDGNLAFRGIRPTRGSGAAKRRRPRPQTAGRTPPGGTAAFEQPAASTPNAVFDGSHWFSPACYKIIAKPMSSTNRLDYRVAPEISLRGALPGKASSTDELPTFTSRLVLTGWKPLRSAGAPSGALYATCLYGGCRSRRSTAPACSCRTCHSRWQAKARWACEQMTESSCSRANASRIGARSRDVPYRARACELCDCLRGFKRGSVEVGGAGRGAAIPLRGARMCVGATREISTWPRHVPATRREAVMRQSDNVVWLRPQGRHEPRRGFADLVVVGSLLTGLAVIAQRLVLALSMG